MEKTRAFPGCIQRESCVNSKIHAKNLNLLNKLGKILFVCRDNFGTRKKKLNHLGMFINYVTPFFNIFDNTLPVSDVKTYKFFKKLMVDEKIYSPLPAFSLRDLWMFPL